MIVNIKSLKVNLAYLKVNNVSKISIVGIFGMTLKSLTIPSVGITPNVMLMINVWKIIST